MIPRMVSSMMLWEYIINTTSGGSNNNMVDSGISIIATLLMGFVNNRINAHWETMTMFLCYSLYSWTNKWCHSISCLQNWGIECQSGEPRWTLQTMIVFTHYHIATQCKMIQPVCYIVSYMCYDGPSRTIQLREHITMQWIACIDM
jgi:hypothetical protein